MRFWLVAVVVAGCGRGALPPEVPTGPDADLAALIAADPDYGRVNWMGDLPTGAACGSGVECQSGRCSTAGAACGQCLEYRRLGESCGAPTQVCSWTAACVNGVCRTSKGSVGALCQPGPKGGDGDDCDVELACVAKANGVHVCQRRMPVGGPCNAWNECRTGASCSARHLCEAWRKLPGNSCRAGATCAAGTGCDDQETCLPLSSLRALGDDCSVGTQGRCAEGLTCGNLQYRNGGGAPWDTKWSCLALPVGGDVAINFRCARGFFADPKDASHTCQPALGVGKHCASDDWCAAGFECRGTCEAPCR